MNKEQVIRDDLVKRIEMSETLEKQFLVVQFEIAVQLTRLADVAELRTITEVGGV